MSAPDTTPTEAEPGVLTRSQLAAALADAYRDIESLKVALTDAERKAEHYESLLNKIPDAERALQELRVWEKRARDAELAREDEMRKRQGMKEVWQQLADYLRVLDECAFDARMGFSRLVDAGSATDLSLRPIPQRRSFPLPPQLPPLPRVRPRTDSFESGYPPPAKRTRFQPEFDPRKNRIRHHHHHHHSRSSSRSSNDSLDVDEMLIQSATESNNNNNVNGTAAGAPPPPQHVSYFRKANEDKQGPGPPGPGPAPPQRYLEQAATYPIIGPSAGPSLVQSYQTHVFAPVVTGAPVKKGKYSSSINEDSLQSPSAALPTSSYPPTNAEGQRICRQCGMPGRYKDGKCVEKWGPGPMGPGTVCDRCRKKMKRVERRGTLESQAQAAAAAAAQAAQQQQQQQQLQQQSATRTSSAAPNPRDRERDLRRLSSPRPTPILVGPSGTHVVIESPTDINHHATHHHHNTHHHPAASSSNNTVVEESAIRSGISPAESRLIKPPPPSNGKVSPSSMDVDADADADADEATSSIAVENDLVVVQSPPPRKTDPADPELELLEAVHAAEANSRAQSSS